MSDDKEPTVKATEALWNKTHESLISQQKQIQTLQQDAKEMAEALMGIYDAYRDEDMEDIDILDLIGGAFDRVQARVVKYAHKYTKGGDNET